LGTLNENERRRGDARGPVLLDAIARTWNEVSLASGRTDKIARLASCLSRLAPEEAAVAVAYLSGVLPQGAIGVGWASLAELPPPSASRPALELLDVDRAFRRIKASAGSGSQAARRRELADLFGGATELEQRFLLRLLTGELRQGALEGLMVDAVARAFEVPTEDVRRARMLAGDLGVVAAAVIREGRAGLARFRLTLLRPIEPMLAQTAADLDDALARASPAAVEWKLDGARMQVHRLGSDVRVFTRNLADITTRVPEVVRAVERLPVQAVVLDGEAIALRHDGRPHPFQITMGRFGSRVDVEQLRREVPISSFFFDCLHVDGEDLIDRSTAERHEALQSLVPPEMCVPWTVAEDRRAAERCLEDALAHGHEGVMVKALDASYEAGRRGAAWLKVKRAHTLDLVVLAAEWGHGRRQGWLSNLHLGARDAQTGEFIMLGKTFKGMTDEMLAWQTEHLQRLETHRDRYTVYVRPELVVEVAFDGLQASSRYPGGLALRFARVKGYRPDKRAAEADTMEAVRALDSAG
jgi:DNA ligase-1